MRGMNTLPDSKLAPSKAQTIWRFGIAPLIAPLAVVVAVLAWVGVASALLTAALLRWA